MASIGSTGPQQPLLPIPSAPVIPPQTQPSQATGAAVPTESPVASAEETAPQTPSSTADVTAVEEAAMPANAVSFSAETTDVATAQAAPEVAPVAESPIEDGQIESLSTATATAAAAAFEDAPEGSPMQRLQMATNLIQVLNSETLGPEGDQTLAQQDQEAYETLQMRRPALEQEIQTLMSDPEVQAGLEGVRQEAMQQVFGQDAESVVEQQAQYMTGDAFHEELAELPPEQQAERMRTEMERLTTLNPERAAEVSLDLIDRQARETPGDFIAALSRDDIEQSIDALYQQASSEDEAPQPTAFDQARGTAAGATGQVSTANRALAEVAYTGVRTGVVNNLTEVMTDPAFTAASSNAERLQVLNKHLAEIENIEVREATERFVTRLQNSQDLGAGLGHLSRGLAVVGAASSLTDGQITVEDSVRTLSTGLGVADNWTSSRNLLRRVVNAAPIEKVAYTGARRVATEALGPLADAITVPLDVHKTIQEISNEDSVGAWSNGISAGAGVAGVAAGIAIATGSTGVGVPVAVVAAVVGVGAGVADAAFGESDLTGQIRQDLRSLGISDQEEDTAREMTTDTRTYQTRGATRTYQAPVADETVRERASQATATDRIALLNQYIDGYTSESEERMVTDVFTDAAQQPEVFQEMIDNMPLGRLANELDNQEVSEILSVMTDFSQQNEIPPGEVMGDFLTRLAQDHREDAITEFLDAVPDDVYKSMPADTLREMTSLLMDGATSGAEENAIIGLLSNASREQFDAIFSGPENRAYRRRLSSELSSAQIQQARPTN